VTHQIPIQSISILDTPPYYELVRKLIRQGETNASIVRTLADPYHYEPTAMGISASEASIRRFRKRHGLQIPGVDKAYTRINGDEAEAQCAPSLRPVLDDPDKMLRDRGLDPEEWYVDAITVNEWDGPRAGGNTVTYYQAKFTAKRKRPELAIVPARVDGWVRKPLLAISVPQRSKLVVIVGDQQAPFHDEGLHAAFCEWLAWNKPVEGIELGDLIDLPTLSRFAKDPENIAAVNECIQSGHDILRDYLEASPFTEWSYTPGNHDTRLRDFLLAHAIDIYGLKRADSLNEAGANVHDLTHLMRLDELNVRYVDPNGDYEDAQVELSPHLAVRHGWVVRKGSGVSALQTLEQTGYSIVVGHTHRQSIIHHTKHDIYRNPSTLLGAEAGCMCRIDNKLDLSSRRFPSYTVLPDWQNGFCTATIYPDGKFHLDLATYVNETLFWRDQRY
jgi:hypothetical protein